MLGKLGRWIGKIEEKKDSSGTTIVIFIRGPSNFV